MTHYELYCGTYYLVDDKTKEYKLYGTDEISIAFSYDEESKIIMFCKHGSPEHIAEWLRKNRQVYKEILNEHLYTVTGKFPVEEVNKILDICDYIKTFLKKFDLFPEELKIILEK